MSSHHIIRDNQEPALFILDTNEVDWDILSDLLSWSPTVIVDESIVDEVASWGIKIDVVLVSENNYYDVKTGVGAFMLLQYVEKRSEDILNAGFEYLVSANHKAVNIISGFNSNMMNNNPYYESLDLVIYSSEQRYVLTKRSTFSKWVLKGEEFEIFSPIKCTDNLVPLTESEESKLQAVHEGQISIEFQSEENSTFWIGERLMTERSDLADISFLHPY
ncbi:hypothetical protein [Aureibacter tunicatorum]|uniref:Thiamine pyrophosphokinase n=1 Tax=Aureibacter tunicatorum TaxID=866807 RepID=A0AAE4BNV1_9BACT|nr:hypothetical protein [Aureibacter tunicatorum]MDR6237234.1 hypothetical protein [Aureibacter tunicatorum]BDD06226.1 hypothetical protein AUTU_37090 [Aureibacter tunicatorum]